MKSRRTLTVNYSVDIYTHMRLATEKENKSQEMRDDEMSKSDEKKYTIDKH